MKLSWFRDIVQKVADYRRSVAVMNENADKVLQQESDDYQQLKQTFCDMLIDLIDSGIDEGAHCWSYSWKDLSREELVQIKKLLDDETSRQILFETVAVSELVPVIKRAIDDRLDRW